MALETLKGVTEIGGFEVFSINKREPLFIANTEEHVVVDHCQNAISFQIQNGPVKENGVNGCQVDTLIYAAHRIIFELNKKFPDHNNLEALDSLRTALQHLSNRKIDREIRGVEGRNKS